MSELNIYTQLSDIIGLLKNANETETNHVANLRNLIMQFNEIKESFLVGSIPVTNEDIAKYRAIAESILAGKDVNTIINVESEHSLEMFQLGVSEDNVILDFDTTSRHAPEHGFIIQKLWKVGFKDGTTGHMVISDTSNLDLSTLLNAQLSTTLATAPNGAVEDLNLTIALSDIEPLTASQDLSSLISNLEKPGLVPRQLRDIDLDLDPELQSLSVDQKNNLKNAVGALNSASTDEDIVLARETLQLAASDAGLYSTSLGPTPNFDYSDLKRFNLRKNDNTIVSVVASMPVVSWGDTIEGIPLRDPFGPKNKTNRKDNGTSYIVDLGGIDAAIRNGRPNPLPATKYYNNGPTSATDNEGALERYAGGKSLGINTTNTVAHFIAVHREQDGEIIVSVPPMSTLWKLDRATFDGSNRHAYYTVFSASRPPPAGFMGGVFAPKQNRLGRGHGVIASGVTLANGVSKTGKTFNLQNSNGPILTNGLEVPSNLKGVTCDFDGHGMAPNDLLTFFETNSFIKGTNYLTIPANATIDTVEDVLIPEGQFIPHITQALGTLIQFANGRYIQDGGPSRFQPGLIPFMPDTPAYTPEWHINWIVYNCGTVECDGVEYPIENPALDSSSDSWIRPNHNPSFGPPGPNPANSPDSKYSPAFPDTFDPAQLRCNIKWTQCRDYVDKIDGSVDGQITLSMLSKLENDNKIFITDAPPGALRGWVKFLVVNCPVPVVATINIIGEEETSGTNTPPTNNNSTCISCTCNRTATTLSINGDLNPIWLDEDNNGTDQVIGNRILKFKVGDNIIIRSTSGTMHGVSLRLDGLSSNTQIDQNKTLETMQNEVLAEIEEKLTINNIVDLENNIIALSDSLLSFHGGVPVTFAQKASVNPVLFPDGVIIADFTIRDGAQNLSGTVACTVHGEDMSFLFSVCP